MTTAQMLLSLESYYGEKYPALVRKALEVRYEANPWGPVGRKALYELATQKISRSYKVAPDLAQLIPLEAEALDQRDLTLLERKPVEGQKLLAGRTSDDDWEEVETLFEKLGIKFRPLKTMRGSYE